MGYLLTVSIPDDGPTTEELLAARARSERLSTQGSVGCLGGVLAVIALGAGFQPQWAYAAGGIVALAVAIVFTLHAKRALERVEPPLLEWLERLRSRHPGARLLLVLERQVSTKHVMGKDQAAPRDDGRSRRIALVWPAGSEEVLLDLRFKSGRIRVSLPAAELPLVGLEGDLGNRKGGAVGAAALLQGDRHPRTARLADTASPSWQALLDALHARADLAFKQLELELAVRAERAAQPPPRSS
jgi:hypothetical protein